MAGIVEAIGVISGLLGIVSFGIDNFNQDPGPGSSIKFAVALEGPNGPTNTGGDMPDIRVFNLYGEFVGATYDPGYVGPGNVGQVDVEHENQGVYSLMSANNDAICIAWTTTSWSDERGGNKYAVSGDFGRVCGGTWYASGMYPSSDSQYQPDCFWIDGDGDQPKTGFQVRWPAYANTELGDNNAPDRFCNNIDFGLREENDPNVINFWDVAPTKRAEAAAAQIFSPVSRKRRQVKRTDWASKELVLSDSKGHSAKRLCNSETSMGPDFAHMSEKLFCDMGSKTLYNFCGESTEGKDCFDSEKQVLRVAPRGGSKIKVTAQPYERVRDWTTKGNSSKN